MVDVVEVAARPTLVVPATTTWAAYPALWPRLLDEVWAHLRAHGLRSGCPNVMVYVPEGEGVHVEVGVLPARPIGPAGRVVESALPAGRVAHAVHQGPYSGLGDTHAAVHAWCAARELMLAGPRWEIYGPHREDPAELRVDISWLLTPRVSGGGGRR